jgi:hypothetical protein
MQVDDPSSTHLGRGNYGDNWIWTNVCPRVKLVGRS